ncbi:S-layer homology domain-containing protein [Paenibacillus hexagrammi]|uniref:S-layer homology domain-containing protein n=1 Tax=Paenibacillus hexagrammi TaxID=2908839 RepID=A0ABY3SKN7_9BACL|nr:S-layer homology domain-containing protein [Paenibacillus sp. YPD9-1]UJF33789.1 S-layer homology domain-containing protein [Paenibacillus sp. YPD9-1]
MIRTGSRDAGLNLNFGAIWLYADTKPIDSPIVIKDNVALDSTYQGISIQGTQAMHQVSLKNIVIDGAGTTGTEVASSVSGEANIDNVIIRNARLGDVANNASGQFNLNESNEGFASTNVQPTDPTDPTPTPRPSHGGSGGPLADGSDKVKVDDSKLTTAAANGQKRIVIETDANKSSSSVEMNLGALVKAAKDAPDAVVVIRHGHAAYELPVDIRRWIGDAATADMDLNTAVVKVVIEKPEAASIEQLQSSASGSGMKIIGEPVRFGLWLQSGDKSQEVNRFGSTFVTRTLTVDQILDNRTTTALVYDPASGEFRYVPALFSTDNGKTVVTVKSTTNSIYVLAAASLSFPDLAGHWAQADIEWLASKQIVNGKSERAFSPGDMVTRAEFAALLVRAMGLTPGRETPVEFRDVAASDWYAASVKTAAEFKLIQGFEDHTFRPQQTVTREEMAVMIARAMKIAAASGKQQSEQDLSRYQDASLISSWAQESFVEAVQGGVIQGQSADRLAPQAPANRAESAVIVLRALQSMNLFDK